MGNKNLLFESIFSRKFSDVNVREFLEQVTKDHPYFSPAQYFLLLQADKESTGYTQQVAKTSILFNNPHWLKFQLDEYERAPVAELSNSIVTHDNEVVFAENPAIVHSEFKTTAEIPNENELVALNTIKEEITLQKPEEFNTINDASGLATEAASTPMEQENEMIEETKNEFEVSEIEIEQVVEEASMPAADSLINQENELPDEENDEEINQIVEDELIHEQDMLSDEENEAKKEAKDVEIEIVEVFTMDAEDSPVKEENGVQMEAGDMEVKETATDIKTTVHSGHFNTANIPLVNEAETDETTSSDIEEIEPLNFRLNIDTSGTTEDTISFEPLHATDYFASLGIKLSGEIQPTDKLGKQLKSFTEWLKTMKKIHSDQQAQQNGQAEITVQKLAENSNKQQEVVTESMADVLLRQGKAKRAIEVYEKLSLLDSSKSAYFAAKIDQLKEH